MPNRIVVLFSPIFVGLAGWLAQWVARHFPGHPVLDKAGIAAVFVAGAAFAALHVGQWIKGWQNHEQNAAMERHIAATEIQVGEDIHVPPPPARQKKKSTR